VEILVKCFSDEAIEKVELMVDGQFIEGLEDYEEPYEFEWSTFDYEDGTEYSLRAGAITKSGNHALSEEVICKLDNSIYYPAPVNPE